MRRVGFKSFIGIDKTFPGAVYKAEAELNKWLASHALLNQDSHVAHSFQHHTWFERIGESRDFRHVISVAGLMDESEIYTGPSNG